VRKKRTIIKKRYVWLCAYYYLCQLIGYDDVMAFDTLKYCMNYQIEELAYRGHARRKSNQRWFDHLMRIADKKR